MWPRSLDPLYVVTYYIEWVMTFWTYSTSVYIKYRKRTKKELRNEDNKITIALKEKAN